MFKRIDQSPALSRMLESTSGTLAKQRGLLVVIGVLLVAVSFVVQLVNYAAASPVLDVVWTITHHFGIMLALIGLLLIEPLGK